MRAAKKKSLAGNEAHFSRKRSHRDSNKSVKGKMLYLAADGRVGGFEYNEGERGYHETCFNPVQGWIAFE
jgi:hypothetical protein